MSKTSSNPTFNTLLGIAALVIIVFFANWLMSISSLGSRKVDLTEAKVHTLTEGTKQILKDLKGADAEVVISYYATRDSDYMPRELELYMKKVDDFLKTYKSIAGDNLRIVNLDPEPDTDAEDSANLDGIAGQQINNENLYLGISIASLDQKVALPFLNPGSETQLEYQLSSAIARVARTDRPTLGLMSTLPLAGAPPSIPGQQPQPPAIIYQELQQLYELKDLSMTPTANELEGLAAVLLIHPAGITDATEFVLDQYLLNGGTLVAALDAFSISAQQVGAGGGPSFGQAPQGPPATSTLSEKLLSNWGVNYVSDQTLSDGKYRTRMRQGESATVLSLTTEALPDTDNIITDGLNELFFVLSGGFSVTGSDGLKSSSLIRTSHKAGFVDSQAASRLDPSLLTSVRPDGKAYDLALHITGTFKTAFPDGDPSTAAAEEPENAAQQAAEAEEEANPSAELLKESISPGNVFLIADADFIGDQFAYNTQFAQMGLVSPQGDNTAFLFNILDQVTGSKHLIGSRSRGQSRRPFTVIQEMDADFEKKFGERLEKEQSELNALSTNINELIQKQQDQGRIALEGEIADELAAARKKQVEARKKLRELEKDLRKQKDELATRYTLGNLFIIPGVVAFIGFLAFLKRRISTSAR